MEPDVFMWHDRVHQTRETARIQFWRLSFVPQFRRDQIFQGLRDAFGEIGIRSYAIYETLGNFDLLLRLWVPRLVDPEEFEAALHSHLDREGLWDADFMVVSSVDRHWLWEDGAGARLEPSDDDLLEATDQRARDLQALNSLAMAGERDQWTEMHGRLEWLHQLELANLVRPLDIGRQGIKFFVTFDHPNRPFRRDDREVFLERLLEISEAAEALARSRRPESSAQVSIYQGHGTMTDFLLLARAPDQDFYDFAKDLIFGLRERSGIDRLYRIRPYTHVAASRSFVEYSDLPITRSSPPPSTGDLLGPESASLEFKATYSVDLNAFLGTGKTARSDVAMAAVIKAICGMLNSPDGGRVVVGLAEYHRLPQQLLNPEDLPFPMLSRTNDLANPDAKLVTGLDFEISTRAAPFTDFDGFQRHLETQIRERIRPLSLAFVKTSEFPIAGRTLAVIDVRPSDFWFWFVEKQRETFYVREFGSTRAYEEREAHLYRRSNIRERQEL